MTTQYIDITPTWLAVLPILVEVAAKAKTLQARKDAWKELERMATLADQYAASVKGGLNERPAQ